MTRILTTLLLLIPLAASVCQPQHRAKNFPQQTVYIDTLPPKENLWIFIMAGQSNMAGRGFVEAQDTVPSLHILTLNKENKWILAKEPLHFYEPNLTGLDCGLAFSRTLCNSVDQNIYIGIIPTAIGGSSAEQWLNDSTHRGVPLFSNFESKVQTARAAGTIKGILWHQGETNAHEASFKNYQANLRKLFMRFRDTAGDPTLPIFAGELGSFLRENEFHHYNDSVNYVLHDLAKSDKNIFIIKTQDLTHKGDSLHFDSNSQRLMGKRLAETFLNTQIPAIKKNNPSGKKKSK